MSQVTEQVIDVISKPADKREEGELEAVVSWLRRKACLLKNTDKQNLKEIARKCHYETAYSDEVIIQQGEEGTRMFILLRGSALVYIDASLTGEEDPFVSSPIPSPSGSPDLRRKFRSERNAYGKYIMKVDIGKSFGEAALLQDDKSRNATVMAESDCDLLVVDQALFDKTLKAQQRLEYEEIHNFVEHHPFFSHMSPKFKRLLDLSLRKETFAFDSTIIKQGDPVTALYFILVGQANLYVEPNNYQKQYPQLWPFEAGIDLYSQEFEWLRESRKNAILRKYEDPTVWPTKSDNLIVKRTEGYAAIEKLMQERVVCLCSVYSGEVLGDTELVMKLNTSMATVKCTAITTAFILDFKNLERLVGRRNPLTMEIIKETVKEKIEMRATSRSGKDIQFLSYLMYKLNEERLSSAKKLPAIKPAKQLPPKDIQMQHLLERFKDGQAQLVEPLVPGALIYKEQMQDRARVRANIRRRDTRDINAMLREARRRMNRRQPRSRREIIQSLTEMMESELFEVHKPGDTKDLKKNRKDSKASTGSRKKSIDLPLKSPPKSKSSSPVKDSPRSTSGSSDKLKSKRRDSKTGTDSKTTPSAVKEKKTNPKRSRLASLTPRDKVQNDHLPVIAEAKENSSLTSSREISALQPKESEKTETSLEGEEDAEDVRETTPKREYQRKEVKASSKSPTRFPPLAKPELKKPENVSPTKWESALKFVNERINDRFTKQLLNKGGSFDDYETSDMSLNLLENRIKSFFHRHKIEPRSLVDGKKQELKLPPLRRYNIDVEDSDVTLPKPGGKVWIQKRVCRFADSDKKVKDHDHVRYHMVDELPQFDEVKKKRIIMHHLMSGALRGSPSRTGNSPSSKLPSIF